jgi:histone acetyltransferase (RNA polymerase elongator complex component)
LKILPLFIPHLGCPFSCVYCNQKAITKISSLDLNKWQSQIDFFCKNNPDKNKQIAFFGGTFTNLKFETQQQFFDIVKPFNSKISGIRISTRPDCIDENILQFCHKNNVQTIELGIQSFDDVVLQKSGRGYSSKIAIENALLIKKSNFELGIQLMPGLPGFSENSLQNTIEKTLKINPDFVRIYPTIVIENTILAQQFRDGKFSPINLDKAISVCTEMVTKFTNISIAKIGLHSDIEPQNIVAGPFHPTFGELVRANILMQKIAEKYSGQTILISKNDISLFKGFKGKMMEKLKTKLKINHLPIIIDKNLSKNKFLLTEKVPQQIW